MTRFRFELTSELDGQIKAIEAVLEGPTSAFEALRRASNAGAAAGSGRGAADGTGV